jgi:succinate dehydrogenase flavin-adding protein (antitoxin of CptAB toxin-antitoxin module)
LDDADVSPLNALLDLPDDDLWDIVTGRSENFDPQLSRIVKRLRATSVARPSGAA